MKVVHMPYNIASWAPINVQALKAHGVDAKAVVFGGKGALHEHNYVEYIPQNSFWEKLKSIWTFYKLVKWADIIHWYYDDKILPFNLALKIVRWSKKPAIVEWLGSDIRDPRIEFQNNPYYKEFFDNFGNSNPDLIGNNAFLLQKKFGDTGFASMVCPEMKEYLKEELYRNNYLLRQRIDLESIQKIQSEETEKDHFYICHAPSQKDVKGTKYIIQAIDQLINQGYPIKFDLIENVPHSEALKRIAKSDIFIDQLNLGAYGMAALEGLSLNKTVLCFIKKDNIPNYPEDCPILNVNKDNIQSCLKDLLNHPEKIYETGSKGRNYVDRYHSTRALIPELIKIYQHEINLKGKSHLK
ncbi:MAG: hypothetical protein R2799_11665 [Crocinitomicaceae bacterium]